MPAATRTRRLRARGGGGVAGGGIDNDGDVASQRSFASGVRPALVTGATSTSTAAASTPSIFEAFADVFRQLDGQQRDALLDGEDGVALHYAEVCRQRWAAAMLERNHNTRLADGLDDDDDELRTALADEEPETMQWALEYYTWMLLHALSRERTETREKELTGQAHVPTTSNLYHPALLRASDVLAQSPHLRELNIVREWLHNVLDPYEALPSQEGARSGTDKSTLRQYPVGSLFSRRADIGGASSSDVVEVRKGYWTFTKNALRAAKRNGQIPPSNSTAAGAAGSSTTLTAASTLTGGIGIRRTGVGIGGGAGVASAGQKVLKTLDPDAPCRAGEGELSSEDMAYERAFLRSLFVLTRAGKLHDALNLCRQADRPWRAASLRGAIPYYDARLVDSADGTTSAEALEALPKVPYGNRNRALWKATARKLADMKTLDPYERALYGALCGSLEPVLACSSSTWEEAVWAYINAKLEAGIESGLRKALFAQRADVGAGLRVKREEFDDMDALAVHDGAHGEPGTAVVDGNEAKRARVAAAARLGLGVGNDLTLRQSEDETALETMSLADIFEQVEGRVERGSDISQSSNPFRATQRVIIVGDVMRVLQSYAQQMETFAITLLPETHARYVRFFAHIVLYLRSLRDAWQEMLFPDQLAAGQRYDYDGTTHGPLLLYEPICDDILREYIRVLCQHGQSDRLVALYSSKLSRRAAGVEEYAVYLRSMGPDTPAAVRAQALARSTEFGLDLGAVARRCVQYAFTHLLPHQPPPLELAKMALGELSTIGNQYGLGVQALSHAEVELIHALEWLTYAEETLGNAVVRCNQMIRISLASGHLAAARQALTRLPEGLPLDLTELVLAGDDYGTDGGYGRVLDEDGNDLMDEDTDDEAAAATTPRNVPTVEHLEYMSWRRLFEALDAHRRYLDVLAEWDQYQDTAARRAEAASILRIVVADAERAILDVLEQPWLQFELSDAPEDIPEDYAARQGIYSRIRQVLIPELVLSLHHMLVNSSDTVVNALARALVLPNLVADGLWEDFIADPQDTFADDVYDDEDGFHTAEHRARRAQDRPARLQENRLPEYLEAVRQAQIGALGSVAPDPFWAALQEVVPALQTEGDAEMA